MLIKSCKALTLTRSSFSFWAFFCFALGNVLKYIVMVAYLELKEKVSIEVYRPLLF